LITWLARNWTKTSLNSVEIGLLSPTPEPFATLDKRLKSGTRPEINYLNEMNWRPRKAKQWRLTLKSRSKVGCSSLGPTIFKVPQYVLNAKKKILRPLWAKKKPRPLH